MRLEDIRAYYFSFKKYDLLRTTIKIKCVTYLNNNIIVIFFPSHSRKIYFHYKTLVTHQRLFFLPLFGVLKGGYDTIAFL